VKELIIATSNEHKAREYREMLEPLGYTVLTLKDIAYEEDIVENADTFAGNALIKARIIAEWTGKTVVSDDTGLCVAKLNGAPGVYSARYAGFAHDYGRNNEKLLAELGDSTEREAYFVTVICLYELGKEPRFFEGRLIGNIAKEKKGTNGFGYDPLFVLLDGRHLAELSLAEKNRISHRSSALQALTKYLKESDLS
jgi:XTP/dITP diphosphohydrolase